MNKIVYVSRRFHGKQARLVTAANEVVDDFARQGYTLTLRQLYYRLVSRNVIANTTTEYARLGDVISQARLAGMIDWDAIEDRTRNLKGLQHWDDPPDAINWLKAQFALDKWADQRNRVEVWIEKEALAGVFERVCVELDVPLFCCRGYNSQSEMWRASQRLIYYAKTRQTPTILHFGDHDPSGIDMTRDIADRMRVFGIDLDVDRRALNIDQVKRHKLPPNPARVTDSRFRAYAKKYGSSSWELDALEPAVLADLVRAAVREHRDETEWAKSLRREKRQLSQLARVAKHWKKAVKLAK